MDTALETRFEKLESQLSHLERQYDQLNRVVIEQDKLLKKLSAQQRKISETVETIELERIQSTRIKPPHYQ